MGGGNTQPPSATFLYVTTASVAHSGRRADHQRTSSGPCVDRPDVESGEVSSQEGDRVETTDTLVLCHAGAGGRYKRVSCGNWVPTVTRPPPRSICEVTLPLPAGGRGEGPDMEVVRPARASLLGILLLLVKLLVLVSVAPGTLGWGSSQPFTALHRTAWTCPIRWH